MQRLSITLCNGNSRFSMPFFANTERGESSTKFTICDFRFTI